RPDRATRIVRAGGYVIVGLCLVFAAGSDGRFHAATGGVAKLLRPDPGVPVFALMVTFFAGLLLSVTAGTASLGRTGLAAGAGAGALAGVAAFVVLPFDRVAPPLASGLPGQGQWLALVVFGAPAGAAAVAGWRTRRGDQAVMAALGAATPRPWSPRCSG